MQPEPLALLRARLEAGQAVVAGVLSGTSADGIDVALARPDPRGGRPALLAFAIQPFPGELSGRLRTLLDGSEERLDLGSLARLDRALGCAFGSAARALADGEGLELDLVGSHGQTVWHHDGDGERATLQLGAGADVAVSARATTVSNFRAMDVALGGEGAPLVALCDAQLFPDLARPALLLNLGGIANVTYLAADGPPCAFDTGPAGSLLDGLARRVLDRPFDENGAVAARGRVHEEWVARLLGHPFFSTAPPKSTGRDTFGAAYVEEALALAARLDLGRIEDLLASGVALVARSVARALKDFLPRGARRLVLAGGGARNRTLVRALAAATGLEIDSSSGHGIDPDAREALLFALLAERSIRGAASTEPRVTGAEPGGVLGAIHVFSRNSRERVLPRSARAGEDQ